MNLRKIFVVGSAFGYTAFLKDITIVSSLEDADIVLFTGGEDVDPSYYGEPKHPTTYSNPVRDEREKEIFSLIRKDQLVVGICRGSQYLCILNGGKLVQNCDNHAIWGTHEIKGEGKTFQITSTHHQMQYPYNLDPHDYDVLYVSSPNRSTYYQGTGFDVNKILENGEPEIVLYHKSDLPICLAIQGHPEMIPNSEVAKMLNEKIHTLCDGLIM